MGCHVAGILTTHNGHWMVLRRATFYHKPLAREDHSVWHRVRYRVNLYYEERTVQCDILYIFVTHDLESIAAGVS